MNDFDIREVRADRDSARQERDLWMTQALQFKRDAETAKKLVDRAYKMFWMSGARVVEHNPDHNNPIIAWMADARPFMETLPSIADLNAALAAACKEEK